MLLSTTNYPPTDLALSNAIVAENQPAGTEVGILTATDPEGGPLTYTLVSGQGDFRNPWFAIRDNVLVTDWSFDREEVFRDLVYRGIPFSIRVRATDQEGLNCESVFHIRIENVREPEGSFGVVDGERRRFVLRGLWETMYETGRVTFTLTGGGTGTLYDDGTLSLSGTTAKSVLRITPNRDPEGRLASDPEYWLYGITADGPLKAISAPRVSMYGDMVLNSSATPVGDATVAIRLLTATDMSIQTDGLPIRSLYLHGWIDRYDTPDQIVAPWIGKIRVIRAPGLAGRVWDSSQSGEFGADVVTSSSYRGVAIGSIRTTGAIIGSRIRAAGEIGRIVAKGGLWDSRIAAAGSIGAVSLGFMKDSSILVGVAADFEGAFVQDASEFVNRSAWLGDFRIRTFMEHYFSPRGGSVVFRNNHISAPLIGRVSMTDVPSDSGRFIHVLQDVPMLTIRQSRDGMLDGGSWRAGWPGRPEIIEVLDQG